MQCFIKWHVLLAQVNLQRKMRFSGIITQGASRMGVSEYVKAFKVASSLDGRTYTMYRLEGQKKDTVSITHGSVLL